ncbi:spore coat CotO family protein [Radiobacillus kanasensis]|uniref:CotO family spore coat protein n=1 Tax=Radiobacillus kanasensis TaxID=2844358 RepID=UPI001E64C1D6|nr:CotO family spore coat protein [Radiobacillus kanasensis]UFU00589.1 spore coat CotO family protein [Radiobacillus kanasensis]
MSKRFSRKPMLYIQQPELGKPSAKMQVKYRTPKSKKGSVDKKGSGNKTKNDGSQNFTKKRLKQVVSIPVEEESESSSSSEVEEEAKSQRRKRFKELSIKERVEYFMGLPANVPKMKCQVSTADNSYRGIITNYKDNIVYMRATKRPFRLELELEEITDIQLLGF